MTLKKSKVISVETMLATRPSAQASSAERLEARAGPQVSGLSEMHTGHISFVASIRGDNVKGPTGLLFFFYLECCLFAQISLSGYITTTPVDIESLRDRANLPRSFQATAGESIFRDGTSLFCEVRPKGTMDSEAWEAWLGKVLFPWMRKGIDPVTPFVVVLDGPTVHKLTNGILELLVKFNAILYFLPPETSWSTAPLDLRAFAVHKHVDRRILENLNTCKVKHFSHF